MTTGQTVLLLGGTGRTGRHVLEQLLSREVNVRAIVRSAGRLPADARENPRLMVVEADLLSQSDAALRGHVCDCDVVISCLGHTLSLKGVFGAPRDLVTQAATRLCRTIGALQPAAPIKFILMSSVSVNRPGRLDTRRRTFERAVVATIRGFVPPAKDNQRAADFLWSVVGTHDPFVQWTVVRPDALVEGDVSEYVVHEGLVGSLFKPGRTSMANVAHFMCELATHAKVWDEWKGKVPVVVNTGGPPVYDGDDGSGASRGHR